MTPPAAPRHIAVEGVIGVGKTTLAVRLATQLGAELLREQPEDNPFLERFYGDGPGYALQAQLFFLFQRARQLRVLAQPGMFTPAIVSDYLFDKDALFARLNLSDEEYRLYTQIHAQLAPRVPAPDLVLWLRAPTATLLGRIRRRAIRMEQRIAPEYLERIADAYAAYFAGYRAAPVLVVETERFHPAVDDADLADLLRRIERAAGRAPRQPAANGAG